MLNTSELITAVSVLDTSTDKFKIWALQDQWYEWLSNEYASDLPVGSHKEILTKSWYEIEKIARANNASRLFPEGFSVGYPQVEKYYKKHAALARAELSGL
jgi:hypothetical protein